MLKFICTFGDNQPNEGRCVEVEAETIDKAREYMFSIYGTCWSFIYLKEEWDSLDGIKEKPLKEEGVVPIRAEWRSGRFTIGFILAYDFMTRKYKAYFNYLPEPTIPYIDCRKIIDSGIKMPLREAQGFFPAYKLTADNYDY